MTNTKKIKLFPIVVKNSKLGQIQLIYRNRVEIYKFYVSESKTQIDKANEDCCYDYEDIFGKGWNYAHETDVALNNGFKQVIPSNKKQTSNQNEIEGDNEL
jgi:hypothetical protein